MSSKDTQEVSLEDAYNMAIHSMQIGNYRVAEMTFRDILASVPDHDESLYYMGLALYHMGDLNAAIDSIQKAVKLDGSSAERWTNLAVMLNEVGRQTEAIKAFDKSSKIDPKNPMTFWNKSYALWLMGDYKQAEKDGRKAVKLAPESFEAWLNLGAAVAKLDDLDEAIKCWEKALEINPDNPLPMNNIGNALRDKGESKASEEMCLKALALAPEYPEALNNLGNALLDQGQHEQAEEQYRKAIMARPDYAEAHNNLCVSLMQQSKFPEAHTHGRYAISFRKDYFEAYLNLAETLRHLGQFDEAIKTIQKAMILRPDSAEVHMDMADTLLMLDKHAEAEAELRKVDKLKPDNPRIYLKLANVQDRAGKTEEALETINKALQQNPEMADAYVKRAQIHHINNRIEEAKEDYLKALEIAPKSAGILVGLADLHQTIGELDKSRDYLKKAKKINDNLPGLYFTMSNVKKFTKDDKDFKKMVSLEKKIEGHGLELESTLNFALFSAYEDIGDYKKAFTHLKKGNDAKRKFIPFQSERQQDHFEAIKKHYSPANLKKFKGKGYGSKTPIFIVGMPRSGTTLTEQIISSHPDVFGAGELPHISELDSKFGLVTAKNAREMGEYYVKQIKKRDTTKKAKYITDKMPGNFARIGEIVSILPNAKIIHTRRNPIDNCLSCYKQNFARGQYWSYNLEELAEYYKLYEDLMAYWREVLPGQFLEIDYEDTVSDLETQARKLIDYVGLEWNDACLQPHKQKRAVLTASKMQVIKPVYKTSVKAWERYGKNLEPLIVGLGMEDELKELKKIKKPSTKAKTAPKTKAKTATKSAAKKAPKKTPKKK